MEDTEILADDQTIESTGAELFDADGDTAIKEKLLAESQPFFGRWYRLVSATNWEKGRIIQQWREALQDADAPSSAYSDEAWARSVGGVTAPHAGRLRRVFLRFGGHYETYPGLFWSHFLAAVEWDDAEMWLEGAMRSGWTVDRMREMRWEAQGAVAGNEPVQGAIVNTELEEDMLEPAQGGGNPRSKQMDDDPDRITSGPRSEDPDFGEGPSASADEEGPNAEAPKKEAVTKPSELARPFEGLPELPADLGEALELFKLAIIRHKASDWSEVSVTTVLGALDGLRLLATQPAG